MSIKIISGAKNNWGRGTYTPLSLERCACGIKVQAEDTVKAARGVSY